MTYQEFKNKYNGKRVDYDGYYGTQCWDLGQQYFVEALKLPASVLSGCGLVSNMLKGNKYQLMLKYFDIVPLNDMHPGDVAIWEYGHIAIFDNWNEKEKMLYFFSQNPNEPKVIPIMRDGIHVFRLKGTTPAPKPVENPIKIEKIVAKKIQLKVDAKLWDFDFSNWNEAKSVKQFNKGDIIDVVAIGTNSLGGKYYMTEYSYSNKINNGFNVVDCEDYIEKKEETIEIIEEEPITQHETNENGVNSSENEKVEELPIKEESNEYEDIKTQNNPLLYLIDLIIKLINKIFKK